MVILSAFRSCAQSMTSTIHITQQGISDANCEAASDVGDKLKRPLFVASDMFGSVNLPQPPKLWEHASHGLLLLPPEKRTFHVLIRPDI
jgi:hypothetical protein